MKAHFRLYKEGQGTWARGTLAFLVGIAGLVASSTIFGVTSAQAWAQADWFTIPFFNWVISPTVVLAGLTLIPFGVFGYWIYNYPKLADFLIDTELELKNKVTWPTAKEVKNNTAVVIVATIVLGLWIVAVDWVLTQLSGWAYGL